MHPDDRPDEPSGFTHVPVLAARAVDLLRPALTRVSPDGAGAVYVDATLGLGGHAELFLRTFPGLTVVGLDRDRHAVARATERLSPFADRFTVIHTRYDDIAAAQEVAGRIDGVLFDLGVSSMQLDRAERGFAYSVDAPLDMRMDDTLPLTAADVLNTYSHGDLARILRVYGEERFSGKIASAVLDARETEPFTTSGRLVELLYRSIPAATRRTGGHPAKRTFQALRIEVNAELEALELAVPHALDAVAVGGRVVFMSYQSLEDRIVKEHITARSVSTSPPGLPMDLPGTEPSLAVLTRGGAEKATTDEIAENPRAAPVRLRAVEVLRPYSNPTPPSTGSSKGRR